MHLEEEAKLIEDEMRTTVSFYLKDWQEIVSVVKERSVMPYNSAEYDDVVVMTVHTYFILFIMALILK